MEFEFDEIEILQQASLQFISNLPLHVYIKILNGDRSGLIHIHNKQTVIVQYEVSSPKAFISGISIIIDDGAELIVPSSMYIYGDQSYALKWFGRLTGVSLFVLGQSKSVYLGSTAHTAFMQNGTYLYIGGKGNITFGTLDLRGSSSLEFGPDVAMHGEIGFVDVRYKASILAESIYLKASLINIEAGATITTAALNRDQDTLDSLQGEGTNVASKCCGTGAGHASQGGGIYHKNNTVIALGGQYFGSFQFPDQRGSSGGNSSSFLGGKGGGIIHLTIGGRAFIDGNIMADASSGNDDANNGSGGGSGGSIFIQTNIFDGYGTVSASGGSGKCGGSGGRIAVHTKSSNSFSGKLIAKGGLGTGPHLSSGGPGSVFIEETRLGHSYRKFFLDNSNRHWDQYHTLDEEQDDYVFHELHLTGNASVQMVPSKKQSLTVIKVSGDRTGRIHLHNNHTAYIEENQPLTKTPINLWIDHGAQIYLSSLVYILGIGEVAFKWEGEVIGVRHLRIVPGRNIIFGSQAQTSFVVEGAYLPGTAGWFRFSSFELGSGASISLPPLQGLRLTVGFLVSLMLTCMSYLLSFECGM